MLALLIVAIFLDNIDQEQASNFRDNREPFCHTFLSTFRLLKDWRLVSLIPLTMYSGFKQSFLSGEFTKARGPPLSKHEPFYCETLNFPIDEAADSSAARKEPMKAIRIVMS